MRKAFRIVIAAACVVLVAFAVASWMEKHHPAQPTTTEPGQSSTETTEPEGFQRRTVIDNETCQLVLTDFDAQYSLGPAFRVCAENRSDHKLTISAQTYVNRYSCHPTWAEKQWVDNIPGSYLLGDFYLEAEKDATIDTWLYWKPVVLSENDIQVIDSVNFTFHVTEKNENDEGLGNHAYDCCVVLQPNVDLSTDGMTVLAEQTTFAVRAKRDLNADKITLCYENHSDQPLAFLIYYVEDNVREDLSTEQVEANETVLDKLPAEALGAFSLTLEVQNRRCETDENGNEIITDGDVLYAAPVDLNSLS